MTLAGATYKNRGGIGAEGVCLSADACKATVTEVGYILGAVETWGMAFEESYTTKGCYVYAVGSGSGSWEGRAFFGTGGSVEQMQAPPSLAGQTRIQCTTDQCLAGIVTSSFTRIAAKESDPDRIGYEYYASQSLGNFVQWPGTEDCSDYDPRYRPWCAASP